MCKNLVSVIIPVYNAEKYISKCLDSLLDQTFKRMQIIIINDGSTDNSAQILNKYEVLDDRVSVYHTENRGVSSARNLGIDKATGEYIIFIDADDFVRNDMIEKMYYRILQDNSDVCVCNALRVHGDVEKIQCRRSDEIIDIKDTVDKEEYMITFLLRQVHAYCVWNKMYKRSILNQYNIRFVANEKMYPEDMLFNLMYFTEIFKISWVSDLLYIHIKHQNSITTSYRYNIVKRYSECAFLYKQYLNTRQKWNDLHNVYYIMLNWNFINAVISSIRDNKEESEVIASELKMIWQCRGEPFEAANSKYYPQNSLNIKLYRLFASGDAIGYVNFISNLMKQGNVDELFKMRGEWNANK